MASKACCELDAVKSDYVPKGTYEEVGELKVYITGNPSGSKGIIDVYDIFGLNYTQTLRGADHIAAAINGLVLVPDFFQGDGLAPNLIPPDTPDKQAALDSFLTSKANFETHLPALQVVLKAAKAKWPGIKAWGTVGLCWGGKLVALSSGKDKEFAASVQVHPAALDKVDAEALTIPHLVLASDGEPADQVANYKEVLSRPGYVGEVEHYVGMFHGWMGARANLDNEANAKEYTRGYNQVSAFFNTYLDTSAKL